MTDGNEAGRAADADAQTDAEQGPAAEAAATGDEQPAADAAATADPVAQLGEALAALTEENAQLRDKWLRAVADADNFRKRARRDAQEAVAHAEEKVIRALLPTIDNLQRALDHAEAAGAEAAESLVQGVRMVQKQFLQALASIGVAQFDSVGQPFDPELHEAIQHVSSPLPPNTVAVELHKGYRRETRLVRPAMVAVSRGPEAPPADAGAGADQAQAPAPPETEES